MATYAEIMGQVKDLREQHKYPEAMELIHQAIVAVEGEKQARRYGVRVRGKSMRASVSSEHL